MVIRGSSLRFPACERMLLAAQFSSLPTTATCGSSSPRNFQLSTAAPDPENAAFHSRPHFPAFFQLFSSPVAI